MLDWWDREMTGTVVRFADDLKQNDAGKRVLALAEFILRSDRARYDAAIWSWAEADGKARKVLRRVLQKRLAYISGLFCDAGFPRAEASARGHLLAIYLMGEKAIHADQDLPMRLRLLRRQVRTLTQPS